MYIQYDLLGGGNRNPDSQILNYSPFFFAFFFSLLVSEALSPLCRNQRGNAMKIGTNGLSDKENVRRELICEF